MRIKGKNVFVNYLALLGVRYTELFANQTFNEHPHKNNLLGLSKMLSDYGVQNAATQIEDKEKDIFNIECPFVAHFGGNFVTVEKVDSTKVQFIRNDTRISIPVTDFIKSWSGVILLAETSPDSGEPDYKAHRIKDFLVVAQQSILALACILILVFFYIHNLVLSPISSDSLFPEILGITSLMIVNLIGVYICYLLVLKQLHIHSRYADKICTLFSQSDCNNVLESDAAKLFGVFGWSEIGLGYFTANIVILLFLPQLIPYLAIINMLALPYTVWSVWYQKVRARQWCPLCLTVQVLLWIIFFINLIFGYITVPDFSFHSILSIVSFPLSICLYVIPVFALSLLLPKLSKGNQVEQLRQEINNIKANEEVFNTLLKQQTFYEASKSDSQILFGNPDARLIITILTNPFCNPCAKMHIRVAKLLKETKGNVCIQYIFSAFNVNLEFANRYFTAIYLEKGNVAAWKLYSEWFEKGKALKEEFFKDLNLDRTNPAIEVEFQKHSSWKEKTQLRATPTIIVNGYKLPENYKIEDLRYFTEFDFDH